MIRLSKPCRFQVPICLAAVVALGCGSHPSRAAFATAAELPEGARRPDGVVVEPSPELPVPIETRHSDAALVALRPPLPDKAALRVIATFFRAVVEEDIDAVAEVLTADASVPSKSGGSQPLIDLWRARMRQLRYQPLAGELLYQEADLEFYRYSELELALPGRPQRPAAMVSSDLLVRAPMRVVQAGSDHLFGTDLLFLLRRERDRFRIRQIFEDFQVP
jgi:hypothetical protein